MMHPICLAVPLQEHDWQLQRALQASMLGTDVKQEEEDDTNQWHNPDAEQFGWWGESEEEEPIDDEPEYEDILEETPAVTPTGMVPPPPPPPKEPFPPKPPMPPCPPPPVKPEETGWKNQSWGGFWKGAWNTGGASWKAESWSKGWKKQRVKAPWSDRTTPVPTDGVPVKGGFLVDGEVWPYLVGELRNILVLWD